LFKLAEKIKADLWWLNQTSEAWLVVINYDNLEAYAPYYEVIKEFMVHPQLYTWPYIAFMRTQLSEIGMTRIPTLAGFLTLLKYTKFEPAKLSVLYD